MLKKSLIILAAAVFVTGCAGNAKSKHESLSYKDAAHSQARATTIVVGKDAKNGSLAAIYEKPTLKIDNKLNAVTPESASSFVPKVEPAPEKPKNIYSFSAKAQDIRIALTTFAEKYSLNIVLDKEVKGEITISFSNVTLEEAIDAILESSGFYAVHKGNMIKVKDIETRIFHIDYMNSARTGSGSSTANMSSGSGSSGSSGSSSDTESSSSSSGGGSSASGINIQSNATINFYEAFKTEIEMLISKGEGDDKFKGNVVINPLSGTIVVTDRHKNVENIANYIRFTEDALHRQVMLVVRIIDFSRNDGSRLGIDWERLTNTVAMSTTTALGNAVGGGAGLIGLTSGNALDVTFSNNSGTFKAIVSAMAEQGEIELVSSPQIRTLNNQAAMVKVGTDRTFFRTEVTTTNTTAGSNVTQNDVAESITIGFIMSIIPQISKDGKIIMDISPVMTALNGVDTSQNGSTAAILDVKQISSVVRVDDGETVVVGGLVQTNKNNLDRSIPFLGKIPFIGSFFKTAENLQSDKELVIFITPYLVDK